MKKFIFILLLQSYCSFGQNLQWNKVYNSLGNDGPMVIRCNIGCTAIMMFNKDVFDTLNQGYTAWSLYKFNSVGDTSRITTLDRFKDIGNDIIFSDERFCLVRTLEQTSLLTQNPPTFGRTSIRRFNKINKSLEWERFINTSVTQGENYFGYWPADGLFYPNPFSIYYLGSRELYPTVNIAAHPFIQEYDTSGLLLREADFFSPFNRPSVTRITSKLPDGDILIAADDRTNTQQRNYVRWIEGATFNSYKLKYLPTIYRARVSSNNFKVIAIKPGDKYLVHYSGDIFNSIDKDTITYLTDSSLSLQNAFWVKRGKFYTHFTALDDGNIFAYFTNSRRNRVDVEKINSQTGAAIWSMSVAPPVPPLVMDPSVLMDFDDSGNVYFASTSFISAPNLHDIWIAKLANVGQPWDPWATNPQGLSNKNKPLSLFAYPNPTSSRFRLRGYKEEESLTLRLFSNSGKEVWRGVPSPEGEVDISNLSPGLYHVEALTTSGKRWSTRVVRE